MPKKRVHDYEVYGKEWYGRLSIWARELLDGLIDFADDEGFGSANPKILRSKIFPFDDLTLERVEELLQELKKSQPEDPIFAILEREIEGGVEQYYWLKKFLEFQPRPDYPVPSKIANTLICIGKLDRVFNGGVHRKFCRQWAKRKHGRAEKVSRGEERRGVVVGEELERIGIKEIIELFNSVCNSFFPEIKKEDLADDEIHKIKLRLQKHPKIIWWKTLFEKVIETPFLKGENDRSWKPEFTWFFKNASNVMKVHRGYYDKGSSWMEKYKDDQS